MIVSYREHRGCYAEIEILLFRARYRFFSAPPTGKMQRRRKPLPAFYALVRFESMAIFLSEKHPIIKFVPLYLWLANCYFAHNSLRFPALLPFFNASFRRPVHPLNRRPDPVVPTWRRPFSRCRVPSAQTLAPDRK
jgi:hypothetical protein